MPTDMRVTPSDSRFLTVAYDLDGPPPGTPPRRSIVVCATPGVHADTLTGALHRCAAGVPMEYVDGDTVVASLARCWQVVTLEEYITALHSHRTTTDGVFGMILQWRHLRRLHRQVSGPAQMSTTRTTELVAAIAPNAQVVLTRHGDTEVQAVRAALVTTGATAAPPDVAAALTHIAATEWSWRQWTDAAEIEPVVLGVDDTPTLDDVARRLELAIPDGDLTVVEPALSPAEQHLLERFRADVASGALDIETLPPPLASPDAP